MEKNKKTAFEIVMEKNDYKSKGFDMIFCFLLISILIQKFFLIGSILYCEETHSGGAYNMEKTKKIDVFNSTPRKIKCITK